MENSCLSALFLRVSLYQHQHTFHKVFIWPCTIESIFFSLLHRKSKVNLCCKVILLLQNFLRTFFTSKFECVDFFVVQSLSCVQLFVSPWTAAHHASLSFTISQCLSTQSVMLSNHLILCHPFLLLPSIFPNIRAFSSE